MGRIAAASVSYSKVRNRTTGDIHLSIVAILEFVDFSLVGRKVCGRRRQPQHGIAESAQQPFAAIAVLGAEIKGQSYGIAEIVQQLGGAIALLMFIGAPKEEQRRSAEGL